MVGEAEHHTIPARDHPAGGERRHLARKALGERSAYRLHLRTVTLDLVRIEQRDQPRLSQAFWLSLPARRKSGSGARAQTSSATTGVAVGEKRRVTLIR
jgi:hypothetical protein